MCIRKNSRGRILEFDFSEIKPGEHLTFNIEGDVEGSTRLSRAVSRYNQRWECNWVYKVKRSPDKKTVTIHRFI